MPRSSSVHVTAATNPMNHAIGASGELL